MGEPLDLPEPMAAEGWSVGASLLLDLVEPLEGGAGADEGEDSDEAPVFYRPSAGSDGAVCGDLGDFPGSSRAIPMPCLSGQSGLAAPAARPISPASSPPCRTTRTMKIKGASPSTSISAGRSIRMPSAA